ncbi:MAG: DegT/DnrJ/EryC1/StrS family aminotransferase [Thermoanaerobaculia bacterium]
MTAKRWSVPAEAASRDRDLGDLRAILPGPEPALVPPADGSGILPVSETRLDGREQEYLTECIRTNWVSSAGPFVMRFEDAFAAAAGCRYGIACTSGTAALHLALVALGVGPGDDVIIPAFTMIATPNAVRYTGATPVLADAEADTWNLDPGAVRARVTPGTKGIIAVHTYGHPADADALGRIAEENGLFLLEDAAEAHGAVWKGRRVGSLGDAATFSFYGNKIVTTGEGGMVTTDDEAIARTARRLRDHAFSPDRHFWHTSLGFNYRMTNLQAAVGLAQTERMESLVEARRQIARWYRERLVDLPGLTVPVERPGVRSVFWMFGILVGEQFGISRDLLRARLAAAGIETRSFFVPIHLQPVYLASHRGERYPVAEDLCARGLYLPTSPWLTEADVERVAKAIQTARAA